MANLKDIAATLALLGSVSFMVSGCKKDEGTEVPAGDSAEGEKSCSGEDHGDGEKSCSGDDAEASCSGEEGGDEAGGDEAEGGDEAAEGAEEAAAEE